MLLSDQSESLTDEQAAVWDAVVASRCRSSRRTCSPSKDMANDAQYSMFIFENAASLHCFGLLACRIGRLARDFRIFTGAVALANSFRLPQFRLFGPVKRLLRLSGL